MIIFNENNAPILIKSVYDPIVYDFCWVLDLEQQDYMLHKITMLEEINAPVIFVEVEGVVFPMPANWNMLIFSEETGQLDIADGQALCAMSYTAHVSGPDFSRPLASTARVVDYKAAHTIVTPSLSKHQMLCHAINDKMWVNISPSDSYSKYLREALVGDFY